MLSFDKCSWLYNHKYNHHTENSHHRQPPVCHACIVRPSPSPAPGDRGVVLWPGSRLPDGRVSGVVQCTAFVSLAFFILNLAECTGDSPILCVSAVHSFVIAEKNPILGIYPVLFLCLSDERYLGCFQW